VENEIVSPDEETHRPGDPRIVSSLIVAAACTSSSSSSSSASGACSDYFNAEFARCDLVGYPSSEVTRLAGRWSTYCESILQLPGTPSGFVSALQACTQATAAQSCQGVAAALRPLATR